MEVRGGDAPWPSRYFQVDCGSWKTHTEQRKKGVERKEQQRNSSALTENPFISLVPLTSSLEGLSVTSSNNKARGEEPGVKLSLRKEEEKLFSPMVLMFVVAYCFGFVPQYPNQ